MSEPDEWAVSYEAGVSADASLTAQLTWLLEHRWTVELSRDSDGSINLHLRRHAVSIVGGDESRFDEQLLIKEQASLQEAVERALVAGRAAERAWEEGARRALNAMEEAMAAARQELPV